MPILITGTTQDTAKMHGFVPRSTDSDNTTHIAVISALGGLLLLVEVFLCFRWLIWRSRSSRAKKGRRDREALNHDNSCATVETCADLSDGDGLGSGCDTESQIPAGRNLRANEAVTTRFEYQILCPSSQLEDRHTSTYAEAPNSPVSTVQQTCREADRDSPAHPLESLPQSDAMLSEGVPDVPSSSGRSISLMQREIDELRARVDALTRRQQPEPVRHCSISLSEYSDARTSPPSYSEVGDNRLQEREI
ncbi:hypothetical protein ACEPAG_8126 [Sanghuangporus baumii]